MWYTAEVFENYNFGITEELPDLRNHQWLFWTVAVCACLVCIVVVRTARLGTRAVFTCVLVRTPGLGTCVVLRCVLDGWHAQPYYMLHAFVEVGVRCVMTDPLPTHAMRSLSASVKHTPVFRVPARFIIGVLKSKLLQHARYMRV